VAHEPRNQKFDTFQLVQRLSMTVDGLVQFLTTVSAIDTTEESRFHTSPTIQLCL